MSDYTKLTDFAAKDALITGNPAKLITGTAHDNEYNAIAVAIATKYDSGDLASEADIDAGTSESKLITPALLAYAFETQVTEAPDEILNAVKTSDTARSLTTVYAADPHLSIAVEANKRYAVQGYLEMSTSASSGAKFQFGVPTSAVANAVTNTYDPDATMTHGAPLSSTGDFNLNFDGSPTAKNLSFTGYLETGANAGNFTIKWAQQVSGATAHTLSENSWMTLVELG